MFIWVFMRSQHAAAYSFHSETVPYLATASLYTKPASALFTISKHRSAPSMLATAQRKRKKEFGVRDNMTIVRKLVELKTLVRKRFPYTFATVHHK